MVQYLNISYRRGEEWRIRKVVKIGMGASREEARLQESIRYIRFTFFNKLARFAGTIDYIRVLCDETIHFDELRFIFQKLVRVQNYLGMSRSLT